MLGETVTIVPSHFEIVIDGFPGTRLVKLVEPEVVRQVGLIWVDGDPMLPMARATLDAVKAMAMPELHAARFVSEERHQNGYLAFSLNRQALKRLDVLRASRCHGAERIADYVFER